MLNKYTTIRNLGHIIDTLRSNGYLTPQRYRLLTFPLIIVEGLKVGIILRLYESTPLCL